MSFVDPLPDSPDPANDIPAIFNQKAAALVLAQKAMVPQINALAGNLNSIAFGGAYAIPYVGWGSGDPSTVAGGNGRLVIPGTQNAATSIWFNIVDLRGINMKTMFDALFSSASAVKAYITLAATADPTRWLSYQVTGWTYDATNSRGVLTVTCVGASAVNPLAAEGMMMSCTRAGDPGNVSLPTMLVRDMRNSGIAPQSLTSGAWRRRTLNNLAYNSIPGATLSNDMFSLPAGGYWFDGTAPASGAAGAHQARLFNVTANGPSDLGSNEVGASGSSSRSIIRTALAIGSQSAFAIDHWVTTSSGGGVAVSSLQGFEIYTEMKIIKVY